MTSQVHAQAEFDWRSKRLMTVFMNNTHQTPWFTELDLSACLARRLQLVSGWVAKMDLERFQDVRADAALAAEIVAQVSIVPLVLPHEQMQSRQSETMISRSVETDEYAMPVTRQRIVGACRMKHLIPFTGDALLWRVNNGLALNAWDQLAVNEAC